jgi:hypothetical protein
MRSRERNGNCTYGIALSRARGWFRTSDERMCDLMNTELRVAVRNVS